MENLLVNWTKINEIRGGCESLFNDLKNAIPNSRLVGYSDAAKNAELMLSIDSLGYGKEPSAAYIIDEYINYYNLLNGNISVVSNAGIAGVWFKPKYRLINIFNDPYKVIFPVLTRLTSPDAQMRAMNVAHQIKYSKIATRMQIIAGERAEKNICVSEYMKKIYEEMGVKNLEVIHPGVDFNVFKPLNNKDAIREKYGIPKDKKVIISVTKPQVAKGWHILKDLCNTMKDVHWLFVCTNIPEGNIKIKKKNVTLLNTLPREQMPELYNAADVFCLPSLVESYGISTVEAMACNLPIVMSKTGLFSDWGSGDCGKILSRFDPKLYEDSIREILKGEETYSPRKVAEQEKLDLDTFNNKWRKVIG